MNSADLEELKNHKRTLEREIDELKKRVSHDIETKVKLDEDVG
jgi:hypothetical protein